jgi:general stress protein CsbA
MKAIFYETDIFTISRFVFAYFYMGLPGVVLMEYISNFDRMTRLIVGPILSIGGVSIISYLLGYFLNIHLMYHWVIPAILIIGLLTARQMTRHKKNDIS